MPATMVTIDTHLDDIRARVARFATKLGPYVLDIALSSEDEPGGSIALQLVVLPGDLEDLSAKLDIVRDAFPKAFPSGRCEARISDPMPCKATRRSRMRVVVPAAPITLTIYAGADVS